MTKKNILTAIVAVAMSASILSGACFNASASTADGTTDPNFVPGYTEEPELELAPPIRLMTDEEIPVQAHDAIFETMDQNDDGEVRIADAIQAHKEGNEALSKAICYYIVNEARTDITACAVPLQMINDYIRSDQFQLVSVWKDDTSGNEPYMAHFMFLNTASASFFVYETNFVTDEQGFINFWDVDGDRSITEKDAARVYLDSENELKALSISAYAQDGWDAFATISDGSSKPARELEHLITRGDELIGVDGEDLTIFSYEDGIMNLLW